MRCRIVGLVSQIPLLLLIFFSFSCDSDTKYREQKEKEKETLDNLESERRTKLDELEKLKNEIAGLKTKNDSLDSALQNFESSDSQMILSRALELDHVVIAVNNLNESKILFESQLGFSIKEGYLHENGLLNAFVKFENGSYIELLTVQQPEDKLSKEYYSFLKTQQGGAFTALKSDSLDKIASFFKSSGISTIANDAGTGFKTLAFNTSSVLGNLFLIEYSQYHKENSSFTNHPNGVSELYAVWISTPNLQNTLKELSDIQFELGDTIRIPVFSSEGVTVELNKGKIFLFENPAEEGIVGFTLICRNINKVTEILRSRDLKFEENSSEKQNSILLLPKQVYGLWIEFIEYK